MSFGQMPPGWIAAGGLTEFSGGAGVSGRMLAAAKCYLAIAGYRMAQTDDTVLSTSDFQAVTGLSKPMIFEGLTILDSMELITIDSRFAANTNAYRVGDLTAGFRKVPQDILAECLPLIPNRGIGGLDAVKLYIALLYYRDEATHSATVSHQSLRTITGIRPENITKAYSVLHTAGLVVVERMSSWSSNGGHPMNVYRLKGDFVGRRARVLRPTEQRRKSRATAKVAPWAQ
ncbi:hypothetical protein [Luteibacter sp. ME-Dv--P-043b]|uniref:hypothetical protein n=1 Tax=Luteibacter sp. ME-Dv--P-043b TaxID=3040291 RepID=UPI002553DE49|nr:hypothetical protein [Luteibacter sp. ME-Dv--P-043b]